MNVTHAKVDVYESSADKAVTIPIAVPSLVDVRTFAQRLHAADQPYADVVWGWPVYYDPEVREDEAAFDVPDGVGGFRTEFRPFWSPASFTIGESGVWFFSMLWENGRNETPVEFLDERNILTEPKIVG